MVRPVLFSAYQTSRDKPLDVLDLLPVRLERNLSSRLWRAGTGCLWRAGSNWLWRARSRRKRVVPYLINIHKKLLTMLRVYLLAADKRRKANFHSSPFCFNNYAILFQALSFYRTILLLVGLNTSDAETLLIQTQPPKRCYLTILARRRCRRRWP